MIRLYQFPPAFGLSSASPFCIKLEAYLKMAGIEYQTVVVSDTRKAPKGKLPYIDDDGTRVGDSGLVIQYLERTRGVNMDAWLDDSQKAVALAFTRLLEEHFYWGQIYDRWMDEKNWPVVRETYFAPLPGLVRNAVAGMIRRQIGRDLQGHGIGRHSAEEIHDMAAQTLRAIAAFIGEKPYFMGKRPSAIDATAYAFLAGAITSPFDGPTKQAANSHANLVAYQRRIQAAYFP